MNLKDEMADEFLLERFGSGAECNLLVPGDPESTLRPKTCTVPLSLEAASHCAFEENAKLYISALSAPLLICIACQHFK